MKILALDISSTTVGVCYDGQPRETWKLKGDDIASRCQQARALLARRLQAEPDVDFVVFEEPVGKFIKAIIPQACVQGAVLALLSERSIAWRKLAPAVAKKALTGKGNAKKPDMIAAAQQALGGRELDEHQADSYGLWLAATRINVIKEPVA